MQYIIAFVALKMAAINRNEVIRADLPEYYARIAQKEAVVVWNAIH